MVLVRLKYIQESYIVSNVLSLHSLERQGINALDRLVARTEIMTFVPELKVHVTYGVRVYSNFIFLVHI